MKTNNKGFTLVELLGVFAILGIIMLVAIPNVMGILDQNKKNTFVEHAKQMIALTEYKMSSDTSIAKVDSYNIIIFTLDYLDTDDIKTSPNGVEYDLNNSFVAVYNYVDKGLQYYVSLMEQKGTPTRKGIKLVSQSNLNKSNVIAQVNKIDSNFEYCTSCVQLYLPDGVGYRNIQTLYR